MLLIIGANGLLGRHAAAYFPSAVRASHRPGSELQIDLSRPVTRWPLPSGITHALICSSITQLDACARDPVTTGLFNVTHTLQLLRLLLERKIVPIFCSTDVVFDGSGGNYREGDERRPGTEYGRQKKAVEDFLLGHQSLIVRMSKLYSPGEDDSSPIQQMLDAFSAGKTVRCATDQVIVPTVVSDIVRCLDRLIQLEATGVYHIAALERHTRYSLGLLLAETLGVSTLVQPCSIADFQFYEPRPKNNSLDVSKIISATGYDFATVRQMLPVILRNRER